MNDNTPNAAKLIESLRSTGYNNYSAICDLIDNSLDAHASRVRVDIGMNKDDYIISIADNGDGMSEDIIDQAMRLGSEVERDESRELGKFGMGLITASISIGKRLVVITKQHGQYITAIHDIDEVIQNNKFVKTLRKSNESEINAFIEKTGGAERGTYIQISKIDRLQNKNLSIFRGILMAQVGEVFREYIDAGKVIFISGKDVRSRDPLMISNPNTVVLMDDVHEVATVDGRTETIRLRVSLLPKLSRAESTELKINIRHQGFYLMRNNRQIAGGETLDVFTKHNDYNRFRAELFFNGSLDKTLGVGFTKDEVKINDSISVWLKETVGSLLSTIKHQSERAKSEEVKDGVDHASSSRAVKLKSKLLPDSINQEIAATTNGPNWREAHDAEVVFSTARKDRLGPIFNYDVDGRKIKVTYNVDHPFYRTVFGEVGDNKELSNSIDFIVYSIAAGLSRISSEETEAHIDNFMVTFSNSLRTLLD